jgi:two-component system nitrate/nitrite response regulator NarL
VSADLTHNRFRVFLAEDHPVFLEALARLVKARAELELIGQASDGRSALEAIRELAPDVAVVDLDIPRVDGLDVLKALESEGRDTVVMMLTGSVNDEDIYRAVAEGAKGVLSKTDPGESIIEAIVNIARGQTVVSPSFHSALAKQVRVHDASEAPVLSGRERDVLRLTADGCSAAEVGEMLHLAVPTVRTHLANIYEKLGVSSAAAAVAEGLRRGLVQ